MLLLCLLKSDRFGMEMLDILMLCFLMNLLKSDRFGMEISFHSPRALNKDSLKVKIRPFRYGNSENYPLQWNQSRALKSDRFGMEIVKIL